MIFSVIIILIFSIIMIGFGIHFVKNPPKDINRSFGYRSTYSMKNKNTWEFSHKYAGRVWICSGVLDLLVSALLLLLFKNSNMFISTALVILCMQLAVLIIVIPLTEIALRKTFDKDGRFKV